MAFELTKEQTEILRAFRCGDNDLKIQAFAGTGKTTVLRLIAEANPHISFLYIAFNKAMETTARNSFPENVKTYTSHALAYRDLRIGQGSFRDRLGGYMHFNDIFNVCGIKPFSSMNPYIFWYALRQTLRTFQNSNDTTIELEHIPEEILITHDGIKKSKKFQDSLIKGARKIWNERINSNSSIPIEHDSYLKMWQLSQANIYADCILFDEAQDANPAILDVVLKQKCRKIFVGDEFQQIYAWRGAINAMKQITNPQELKLTQSFRFGDEIASMGMGALRLKGLKETDVSFRGIQSIQSKVDKVNFKRKVTGIMRTNVGIVESAYRCAEEKNQFSVVGDFEVILRFVESAYALFKGKQFSVKDERLKLFNSWDDLKEAAKHDVELSCVITLVETHKKDFEHMMKQIRNYNSNSDQARVTFTTAHKAKGQEWEQVFLGEDFDGLVQLAGDIKAGDLTEFPGEEVNLLYVAVTRAINVLEISSGIKTLIQEGNQGVFELPPTNYGDFHSVMLNMSRHV